MIGSAGPDIVNPVPARVSELMETGALPVEVRVTEYLAAVFTTTSPNEIAWTLGLRFAVPAVNCSVKVFETPP